MRPRYHHSPTPLPPPHPQQPRPAQERPTLDKLTVETLMCCSVQPIKETADKQAALWCQLILQYSKHQKVPSTVRIPRQARMSAEHSTFTPLLSIAGFYIVHRRGRRPSPLRQQVHRACAAPSCCSPSDHQACDTGSDQRSAAVHHPSGVSCAGRLGHEARVLYLEKLVTAGIGPDRHL